MQNSFALAIVIASSAISNARDYLSVLNVLMLQKHSEKIYSIMKNWKGGEIMKYVVFSNNNTVGAYCFGCAKQCSNVCGTQCGRDKTTGW